MNSKRSIRFARAIALCGLSVAVVAVAGCGDEDTKSPGDAADVAETSDIADTNDAVDIDVAETRETDTNPPDMGAVDGPLAPPDMPAKG